MLGGLSCSKFADQRQGGDFSNDLATVQSNKQGEGERVSVEVSKRKGFSASHRFDQRKLADKLIRAFAVRSLAVDCHLGFELAIGFQGKCAGSRYGLPVGECRDR